MYSILLPRSCHDVMCSFIHLIVGVYTHKDIRFKVLLESKF